MPATVLIAPQEHLATLKTQQGLEDALAFSDADALRALDAITRQRPQVVALERLFAGTSRGTALINRIKADQGLSACEIRIVAHDAAFAHAASRAAAQSHSGGAAAVAVAPAAPSTSPAPLDRRGTRRAPRFKVVSGIELLVDGNPAALIEVSAIGAQVVSTTVLKPNQRIRVSLPDPGRPIRVSGVVAWAAYEMPKDGPRYRAGLEFFDADATAMERFINANKAD